MNCYSLATREQRCRRYLRETGLVLRKSRVRNRWADTYGMYAIVDPNRETDDYEFDMSIDDVETYINDEVLPELLERRRYS